MLNLFRQSDEADLERILAQHATVPDEAGSREKQFRDLLQALPAAIYTTDADGRITFFNRACIEFAGRTPTIGDMWCVTWKLFWPDGTLRWRSRSRKTARSGTWKRLPNGPTARASASCLSDPASRR